MRHERPVPIEREQLGFAAAAKSAFAFLLSHGFRVVDEQITWVRYESNILFVNVYHGRSSYELGLEVGVLQIEQPEVGYPMSALLQLDDAAEAARYLDRTAITKGGVQAGLSDLSEKARALGLPERARDRDFFTTLARQRRERVEAYHFDAVAARTRPAAEDAFRKKNYALAADLYDGMWHRLSPTEEKKLAYARKHAKRTT